MTDAANSIIDLYRRHANAWTKARGTVFSEGAWIDPFVASIPTGATILDLGCGSGMPLARHLVDEGYAVHGVDGSPEMITLFQGNLPGQAATVADMRSLNLGRKFAAILAWDSVFHLTPSEQQAMFPIFRDHSEHGAPLLFTSGAAFGEAFGSLEGEKLYHASLDPEEYGLLLHQNGFDVLDHGVEDPKCGRHTVWLARKR